MINVQDKRIFGGTTDVNQLVPFRHPWAYEAYLEGNRNNWLAGHIQPDMDLRAGPYHTQMDANTMQAVELYLVLRYIGSYICRELLPLVYRNTTSPECRQYMLRLIQEESVALNVITATPIPSIHGGTATMWRDHVIWEVTKNLQAFIMVEDMDELSYVNIVLSILQLKANSVVGLESFLAREAKLPDQLDSLVSKLAADRQRQAQFFTQLLAELVVERPHLLSVVEATSERVNNIPPENLRTHWTGKEVCTSVKSDQHARHCWTAAIHAIGINRPIVKSPYETVKVSTTESSSELKWE